MKGVMRTPGLDRKTLIDIGRVKRSHGHSSGLHYARVRYELSEAGLGADLHHAECKHLVDLLHTDEHIGGAVYGRSEAGKVLLVATDKRVIYLDNKLFYAAKDEISYDVVSGVSCSQSPLSCGLTLHTRVKDYTIRTLNRRAVNTFVDFIEWRLLGLESDKPQSRKTSAVPFNP